MMQAQALSLSDVSINFNGFLAVDRLNLDVKPGELRCLIGPNGAGKTTTLDLICGKAKATTGEIRLGETVLNHLEEHEIARCGIGRKFQVPSVFRQLTVGENLLVAHSKQPGVLRNAFRFRRNEYSEGLEKLAELVGLQDDLGRVAGHLSHGQTQWLEIALLLAQDPKLPLGYDASAIAAMLPKYTVEHIDYSKVDKPSHLQGVPPELIKLALVYNGYWTTRSDEQGLYLRMPGGALVTKEGRPISVLWKDLLQSQQVSEQPERVR